MKYKSIPCALGAPINIDRIEQTANRYSDEKFYVEIYKFGTCVFPPVTEMGVISGVERLIAPTSGPLDFYVKEMDDKNFMVAFSDKVVAIVFADEYEAMRDLIAQQAESVNNEILKGGRGVTSEHMKIGLFARTRFLADVTSQSLIKLIVPRPTPV